MAKLYFRYGAMGSSKTANALMVHYNYYEKGMHAILLKPRVDTRDGDHMLRSRMGLEMPCEFVEEFIARVRDTWLVPEDAAGCAAVIVDEAQFMTYEQVEFMAHLVDDLNVPVICYGLRTDFQSKMFPGSVRLFELADVIEQISTVCWCGKKAHMNARIIGNQMVRTGDQVFIGGNESYVALCRRHFNAGMWRAPEAEE